MGPIRALGGSVGGQCGVVWGYSLWDVWVPTLCGALGSRVALCGHSLGTLCGAQVGIPLTSAVSRCGLN